MYAVLSFVLTTHATGKNTLLHNVAAHCAFHCFLIHLLFVLLMQCAGFFSLSLLPGKKWAAHIFTLRQKKHLCEGNCSAEHVHEHGVVAGLLENLKWNNSVRRAELCGCMCAPAKGGRA